MIPTPTVSRIYPSDISPALTQVPMVLMETRWGLMLMPVIDEFMGGPLKNFGEYTPSFVQLLQTLVHPGSTVIDVGASFGAITLPLAQLVGGKGKVIAFEPQPIIAHILNANVALNNLSQVVVWPTGVADCVKSIPVPFIDLANSRNVGAVTFADNPSTSGTMVEFITIDTLRPLLVSLIKIDVEGMELEVLKGATQTIRHDQPWLVVENNSQLKSPELIEYILGLDYTPYWFIAPMAVLADNFYGITEVNDYQKHLMDTVSLDLLCVPKGKRSPVDGLRVATPSDIIGLIPSTTLIVMSLTPAVA